jgi:hypothetical protein
MQRSLTTLMLLIYHRHPHYLPQSVGPLVFFVSINTKILVVSILFYVDPKFFFLVWFGMLYWYLDIVLNVLSIYLYIHLTFLSN